MYTFKGKLIKDGNRIFLKIPFNVWETCHKKGLISVEVEIEDKLFECKLVPKGKGLYYIPISKKVFTIFDYSKIYQVSFQLIDTLSRIVKNSPYKQNKPIRYIDGINHIKQPDNGLCGQTCLAMLADTSVENVIKIMKSNKYEASMSKLVETLSYFGFKYKDLKYSFDGLPECCVLNVKGHKYNHFMIYYQGKYYDPSTGILASYKKEDITSYLEIIID